MSFAQYNPVNALRRAKDFELAGDKVKALDHLYDVLTSRKMARQWQPAHEAVVVKFIDLCVEFREARKCKEGLFFYRNLASQQNPASLEKVITHLVESSMRKAAEARARTDTEAAGLDSLDDLEAEEQSPEALLMGGVTSDGARDRAEREILVPWVRHMWDTYRNVLETLRNNIALEHLYHAVAGRAMAFCKLYNRATEFRKLCNTLRGHWMSQKQNAETNDRPITPETVERHMATRFIQLEHCAEMALWNEGFRTINDIREMMEDTASAPKPQMLASYYEKLARIFWVSENYLFHAYSWHRFVSLLLARNSSMSEDDRRNLATAVVLSALAIPIYSSGPAGAGASYNSALAVDPLAVDADRKKKNELAALLRTPQQPALAALPTREALIAELLSKRFLSMVRPEVAALFRLLEGDFAPLTVVQTAQPLLAWVLDQKAPTLPAHIQVQIIGGATASAHTLSQYVPNLERLLVFRLLEQLSAVYSTVLIPSFQGLIAGLRMSFFDVEKLAVRAMKLRQLAVRIDHRAGVIRLGSDTQETPASRRQLTLLAARLQAVADALEPASAEGSVVPADRREQIFHFARIHGEAHRREMHRRHVVVRQRREATLYAMEQARIQVRMRARRQPTPTHTQHPPRVVFASRTPSKLQQWACAFVLCHARPLPFSSVRGHRLATLTRRCLRRPGRRGESRAPSGNRYNWAATPFRTRHHRRPAIRLPRRPVDP
jgi:translation initiation factor 3 subunit A